MLPDYFSLGKSVEQPNYRLATIEKKRYWMVDMVMLSPYLNTRSIPATYRILQQQLPAILQSQCFNDDHLPFSEEVKCTEIGHLFEHIILEYLCQEKLANGFDVADFSGETSWNWKKECRGTFHISIEKHQEDSVFFQTALPKSIELMNKILATIPQKHVSEQSNSSLSPASTFAVNSAQIPHEQQFLS